jgi:hypothetical protein
VHVSAAATACASGVVICSASIGNVAFNAGFGAVVGGGDGGAHDAPTRASACQSTAIPSAARFALHTAVTCSGVCASASFTFNVARAQRQYTASSPLPSAEPTFHEPLSFR